VRFAFIDEEKATWPVERSAMCLLKGGAVSTIADFESGPLGYDAIGVTATAVFLSGLERTGIDSFPLSSGVPDGGTIAHVSGITHSCDPMVSDTDAIYCETPSSMLRVASDGTTTVLGTSLSQGLTGGGIAFDDTYVYCLDSLTVGTIMRAPTLRSPPESFKVRCAREACQ
jgi:hypothetical protein